MIGGTVIIPSEETRLNDITQVIKQHQVNWTALTPSFVSSIDPSEVPSLKTLVLAGEALSRTHIEIWGTKVNLVNGYGPSEVRIKHFLFSPLFIL